MCRPCPQGGNTLPLRSWRRRSPKRPCLMNRDRAAGSIFVVGRDHPHPLYDSHAAVNASKYGMLPIQEWSGLQCDEELAAIRVRARVCHRYDSGSGVLQIPCYFIGKLATVNTIAPPARRRRVSCLHHEVPDDAMENDAVVVPTLGQRRHVVACSRSMTIVKLHDEGPDACRKLDVRVRLLSSGLVGSGHCVCLSTSDIQRRCFCWVMIASTTRTVACFSPLRREQMSRCRNNAEKIREGAHCGLRTHCFFRIMSIGDSYCSHTRISAVCAHTCVRSAQSAGHFVLDSLLASLSPP